MNDEPKKEESLQIQKAAWIREEIEKRREQEDLLLQQIFQEQQMLQELDADMDENMSHAKEGRRYREDMKARVDDRVYEMHDLSADKREGMREYNYAYRRGYALGMFFFSLCLSVFAAYLHGITSQICLVLLFFTGVQAAVLVHRKQSFVLWRWVCDAFSVVIFPGMLILFTGYELKKSYYMQALPYCLWCGLILLALTTASYFLYDPYRSARRRVGDAKSMIRNMERSAKKQVKKNQKQQAKEEQRQGRLQKKESEKALKLKEKQELRLEKQQQKEEKKQLQWKQWETKKLEAKTAFLEKKDQLLTRFHKEDTQEDKLFEDEEGANSADQIQETLTDDKNASLCNKTVDVADTDKESVSDHEGDTKTDTDGDSELEENEKTDA